MIDPPTAIDVVVAQCAFDIGSELHGMLLGLVMGNPMLRQVDIFVYSKCRRPHPSNSEDAAAVFLTARPWLIDEKLRAVDVRFAVKALPNTGRNDHSFAYHVARWYHTLRATTLFLKDRNLAQMDHGAMVRQARTSGFACRPEMFGWTGANELQAFSLQRYSKPRHARYRNASSLLRSGFSSLGEWLDRSDVLRDTARHLNLRSRSIWPTCLGGVFAASTAALRRIDLGTWKRIEGSLAVADNVEVGHYMERLWAVLLINPGQEPRQAAGLELVSGAEGASSQVDMQRVHTALAAMRGATMGATAMSNATALEQGCGVLSEAGYASREKGWVIGLDALGPPVRAMRAFPYHIGVQFACSHALGGMSVLDTRAQGAAGGLGAVDLVLSAMKRWPDATQMQLGTVLSCFMGVALNRRRWSEAGGIEQNLASIRSHYRNGMVYACTI